MDYNEYNTDCPICNGSIIVEKDTDYENYYYCRCTECKYKQKVRYSSEAQAIRMLKKEHHPRWKIYCEGERTDD